MTALAGETKPGVIAVEAIAVFPLRNEVLAVAEEVSAVAAEAEAAGEDGADDYAGDEHPWDRNEFHEGADFAWKIDSAFLFGCRSGSPYDDVIRSPGGSTNRGANDFRLCAGGRGGVL